MISLRNIAIELIAAGIDFTFKSGTSAHDEDKIKINHSEIIIEAVDQAYFVTEWEMGEPIDIYSTKKVIELIKEHMNE